MVYIYRNASKCYIAEFTRSVEPMKCISIYSYVLSIGKTNNSVQLQYKQQCPTSLNMKNCSPELKLSNKKGSRVKKSSCKKIAVNSHDEKRAMCE